MKMRAVFILLIMPLAFATGCATTELRVRAANVMFDANPVKEISVLAISEIHLPRIGSGEKEDVVDLTISKKSLEAFLSQTKDVLSGKGYAIRFCEPIGVGYGLIGKTTYVLESGKVKSQDSSGSSKSEKKGWRVEGQGPIYEYPITKKNKAFRKAVHNVFTEIEVALHEGETEFLAFSLEDMKIIRDVVGGDTICFMRVGGTKYTAARKTTSFIVLFLLGMISGEPPELLKDDVSPRFTFVDANTGEVLWQHGVNAKRNPLKPGKKFVPKLLEAFPSINTQMDVKFRM